MNESVALRVSIVSALFFAALGVVVAVCGRSGALLLDGGYSCISATMSLAGLYVVSRLHTRRSARFPYGYYGLEPLFVVVKGALILLAATFAVWSSIESLLHGGRQVAVPIILAYLLFSVVACYAVALLLRNRARSLGSSILLAESTSWMIDGSISAGAFVAFLSAWPLARSPFHSLVPYIDPVLTIAIVAVLIPEPIKLIRSGILDLLLAAPSDKILSTLRKRLSLLCAENGYSCVDIRVGKLGRLLLVTVYCACPAGYQVGPVEKLDALRERIRASLKNEFGEVDVSVVLTAPLAVAQD